MNIEKLLELYWFHNGTLNSFNLDIKNNIAQIELTARRCTKEKKQGPVKFLEPCILRLTFQDLIEASLFNKFPTNGYYLNFTFYVGDDKEIGYPLTFMTIQVKSMKKITG